jgi:DNA-binding XRE family transcriptional regulator
MYLGRTLCALLDIAEKTQTELAHDIGVRRPTINAIINEGTRPHPKNLGSICKWWKNETHGTECLVAHLRDEIYRAGLPQQQVTIQAANGGTRETIASLASVYEADEVWRCLLDDLATMVERDEPVAEKAPKKKAKQ